MMQSDILMNELAGQTQQLLSFGEYLKNLDHKTLTFRKNQESWTILECIEHLNRYGDYYLPEIQKAINQSNSSTVVTYKPTWLGNYFAKSMLPKAKLNKMKTFKDKDPIYSDIDDSVIQSFIAQQSQLLSLLHQAKSVDINKVKVPISIAKFIKINLGDIFRFYINHMIRHRMQIEGIIETVFTHY